ncbi:Alpha-2B adrenergic receptor [Sarracenia purpurea var. burkii]
MLLISKSPSEILQGLSEIFQSLSAMLWILYGPFEVLQNLRGTLSKDIGYVLYSALGSFYIPSCIMVFVYIRIYFAAKARARRGIRKPQTRPSAKNSDKGGSATSLQRKTPSCITTPQGPTISIPIDTNSNNNSPMSITIEPRPTSIPIVTCDYASDASTSDNMDAPTDHRDMCGKDTLKVFTTSGKPPLNSSFRGSTLSINGDIAAMNRCRAPSVGIDTDLVSEFDPSSSDSGVMQKCVTVKPLRLRLCKPIFRKGTSKAKREMIDMGKLASSGQEVQKVKQQKPRDPEREKRRIARKKEKRATLILGLIMGSFILCWLPFFLLYILTPICDCHIPHIAFASAFWLGYMNSALNPVIYTIFNKDFRRAFRRILFK